MNTYKKTIFSLFILMFSLIVLIGGAFAQDSNGSIRFVHVIPGTSPIDIYTNGQLTVSDLGFGTASNYIQAPAGTHTIQVNAAGTATSLWEQSLDVASETAFTLIATSPSTAAFDIHEDDLGALTFGDSRFIIVHAIAGEATVDVAANGASLTEGLAFGSSIGTFDVPAGVYQLAIESDGNALASSGVSLNASTSNMVVAHSSEGGAALTLISAPTAAGSDDGWVRFVHGIRGADAVDILIDDTLFVAALDLTNPTAHLTLPSGDHELEVLASGTDTSLATTSITIEAGSAMSVVALGTPDDNQIATFTDNVAGVTSDQAAVSIINAIPNSEGFSASLADATELASSVDFGDASSAVGIPASNQAITFTVTIGGSTGTVEADAQTFYGGVYYNLIALPGDAFSPPILLAASTNLAQGVASAPTSEEMVVADDTLSEVVTVEPPPAPTEEAAQPATPEPPVVSSTSEDIVTARVALDPGANLHLRQYPTSDALSLGLAPPNTILVVHGREGEPEELEGVDSILNDVEFTDPALALVDEDEDIDPEATWLRVTFGTPDGGQITAWVNALYLEVRGTEGELQRLADLLTIPRNLPGETESTEITPPPIPIDRVTVTIFNLDPGVNLNLRRTQGTDGEVLAHVPVGTVSEFLGFNEEQDWVFINYLPAEGGSITGWVSTEYTFYQWNGRDIDIEELEERELLLMVDEDERGEVGGGASQAVPPTPDPLEDKVVAEVFVDANASLHLRRNPDSTAESLDLIPTNTRLVVEQRTEDNVWLNVIYEGQEGWIASQYAILSFNGAFVEVDEIMDEVPTPAPETDTDA